MLTQAFAAPLQTARLALLGKRRKNVMRQAGKWPISASSLRLRLRQKERFNQFKLVLLRSHLDKQLQRGWRGYTAIVSFLGLCFNVVGRAALKAAYRSGLALPLSLVVSSAISLRYQRKAAALLALAGAIASVVCSRSVDGDDAEEVAADEAADEATEEAALAA